MEAETQAQSLRAKRLEQVRAIINQANNTPYEEERATFLKHADTLMNKYLIEEWEMALARPVDEREKPIVRDFESPNGSYDYQATMGSIFGMLAKFCRCQLVDHGYSRKKVVGFETDLEYLDMLFTSVMLHLSSSIDPRVNTALPWVVNLTNLKNAGRKWEHIHQALVRAGQADYPYLNKQWVRGGRGFGLMVSEYKRYSSARGIPVVGIDPKVWRRSFIAGYQDALLRRVNDMQDQRSGAGLELFGRDEAVLEALYELKPDRRPHPADCECDHCHFMKCNDRACTRSRCQEYWKNANKVVRSRQWKSPAMSHFGVEAGRAKGNEVSLARGDISNQKKEIS